jgi:type IV secretory pathway VirB10-like protein
MKKSVLISIAIAAVALAAFLTLKRPAEPAATTPQPVATTIPQTEAAKDEPATPPIAEPPAESSTADEAAAPPQPDVSPAPALTKPPVRTIEPMPEPSEAFLALVAELRPKVDAAIREGDYPKADRHVDEMLATRELEPLERQRLMAVKLGTRGMRGDHAAMLAMMDEIIAVDPSSPLAGQLRNDRPQIEKIQRLGPNHPELCDTCGQIHAAGQHQPPSGNPPPPQD